MIDKDVIMCKKCGFRLENTDQHHDYYSSSGKRKKDKIFIGKVCVVCYSKIELKRFERSVQELVKKRKMISMFCYIFFFLVFPIFIAINVNKDINRQIDVLEEKYLKLEKQAKESYIHSR